MMGASLLAAALIVFVDVMKELPATFAMRPFNFDTLAVQAYHYASDERLSEAAAASLVIVAVSLVPVILLSGGRWGRRRPADSAAARIATQPTRSKILWALAGFYGADALRVGPEGSEP
jgi:hypothetical protein